MVMMFILTGLEVDDVYDVYELEVSSRQLVLSVKAGLRRKSRVVHRLAHATVGPNLMAGIAALRS